MKPGKPWQLLKFILDSLETIQNSLNYCSRKEGLLLWSAIEMINFFVQMKLNKFTYLYSKPLGNHTLKIMKKIPGNLLKTLKNHGDIMEFCQSEKVGTLFLCWLLFLVYPR